MTPSRCPAVVGWLWRCARDVERAGEWDGKVERAEEVVDGRGRVRAKVGERVVLGGGYTKQSMLEDGDSLEAKTERELYERCPG